jgi:hypothetical protein
MASARLGGDNYLIPRDQSFPIRLAALDAFHCCVDGSAAPSVRNQLQPISPTASTCCSPYLMLYPGRLRVLC